MGNGDSPGFVSLWLRSLGVFAVGETMPAGQRAAVGVLAAILALLGALRLARSAAGRRALWLLVPYLLAPLLITWAGALARPIFNERYIIAALPGLLLMIAGVAGRPGGRAADRPVVYVRAALLAVLLVATLASLLHYYDDPAYSKSRGWRQLAAVLDRYSRSWPEAKVRLAQTYPDPTLWYYVTSGVDHFVLPPAANDESRARALVNQLAAQDVQRVVVAVQPSENWDDSEIAARTLEEAYKLIGETPVGDWRVRVYERPPSELPAAAISFANGLQLAGAAVLSERLSPGDVVSITMQWQDGQQSLSGNEKLTLQLLDAGSKVIAQIDQPFGQADLEAAPATYSLPLARTLPAGSYRLIAALYDPTVEGSPRLQTLDGNDHVVLASYEIED